MWSSLRLELGCVVHRQEGDLLNDTVFRHFEIGRGQIRHWVTARIEHTDIERNEDDAAPQAGLLLDLWNGQQNAGQEQSRDR
jgi:hypothetical protein